MFQNRAKAFAVIFLCFAIGIYIYDRKNGVTTPVASQNSTTFTDTGVKISYNNDSTTSFYAAPDGGIFLCTKDGIKFINSEGKIVWEDVFTLTTPIMSGQGEYVAVSEPKSSMINVYSTKSKIYSKTFDGQVMHYNVNKNGFCTVLIRNNDDYERLIYNSNGECIDDFIHADVNFFPICSAISGDGRIAAVGLVDINNVALMSHITLSYVKKEEQKGFTDGIFSWLPIENDFIISTNFMLGNNLISFTDSSMHFLNMADENNLDSGVITPFNNRIDFVDIVDESGYLIVFGDVVAGKDGVPVGRAEFYNHLGEKISEHDFGKKVTYVNANGQYAVIGINRSYYGFNAKGKLLWEYNATQDFNEIIPLGNGNVLMATNTEAFVMKRGN